ncbi:hypothetical protein F53441_1675 [Fusarium austroafricanum]|uniref:CCHC-type domain-containing protein n=1 Tax=Fusarium austroafricanum TaxID=2364996 RepID=A0A8H4P1Y2_9HYPO|nr:hypothetical protein F53441_1675 [Fusarium austroafricanum]
MAEEMPAQNNIPLEASNRREAHHGQLASNIPPGGEQRKIMVLTKEEVDWVKYIRNAKATFGGGEVDVTVAPRRPELIANKCPSCGSQSHKLATCVTPGPSGSIHPCAFCNDESHLTDQCEQFLALSLSKKVKMLITDRAGMPSLLTQVPWWDWLYEFLESQNTQEFPIPNIFPWRAEFSLEVKRGETGKHIWDIQFDFDATQNATSLPEDLSMQTLEDVWETYWVTDGRTRPSCADPDLRQSGFNSEARPSGPPTSAPAAIPETAFDGPENAEFINVDDM